jgi:hypothetical protein
MILSYDGVTGDATWYLDNVYAGGFNDGLQVVNSSPFYIGGVNGGFPFIGYIDQLRIFDKVIDASERSYYWNDGDGI